MNVNFPKMTTPCFSLLVAHTPYMCVGHRKKEELPWKNILFGMITPISLASRPDNPVIVITGVNTFREIPRGKENVHYIVLSSHENAKELYHLPEDITIAPSLHNALVTLIDKTITKVFVIGGPMLIREATYHPNCSCIFATMVLRSGDVTYPRFTIPRFDLKRFYIHDASFLQSADEHTKCRCVVYLPITNRAI